MSAKPIVTTNGQVVRGQQPQGGAEVSLERFVQNHQDDFARVLPKHMTPDRMVRLAVSAIRTTAHLIECSVPSFASAIMACSVLGIEPNTPMGHAYLVPFKNSKRGGQYDCQLIIGYRGLAELMYRSGIVSSVRSIPVFEGDEFDYELGLHPDIKHRPGKDADRGANPDKLTHVYPLIHLREPGMQPIWDVLNRAQVEQRRRRSAASSSGPWVSDYVRMAMKTGIRSIATWVPSSAEKTQALSAAVAYEEASERGRNIQAVTALGDQASELLDNMRAFPVKEDEDPFGDEVVDQTTGEVSTLDKSTS